jgi:hypothetical protein
MIEQRKAKLAVRGPHPGIVLNEHYEGDGEIVFLQTRLRGHRVQATSLALPLRPLTALGEGQKSEGVRSETRGRRGLGTLSRLSDK